MERRKFVAVANGEEYAIFFTSRAHRSLNEDFELRLADLDKVVLGLATAMVALKQGGDAAADVALVGETIHKLAPKLLFALTRSMEKKPSLDECDTMIYSEASPVFFACIAAIRYSMQGDSPIEKKNQEAAAKGERPEQPPIGQASLSPPEAKE